jgi:hypothetical protein
MPFKGKYSLLTIHFIGLANRHPVLCRYSCVPFLQLWKWKTLTTAIFSVYKLFAYWGFISSISSPTTNTGKKSDSDYKSPIFLAYSFCKLEIVNSIFGLTSPMTCNPALWEKHYVTSLPTEPEEWFKRITWHIQNGRCKTQLCLTCCHVIMKTRDFIAWEIRDWRITTALRQLLHETSGLLDG